MVHPPLFCLIIDMSQDFHPSLCAVLGNKINISVGVINLYLAELGVNHGGKIKGTPIVLPDHQGLKIIIIKLLNLLTKVFYIPVWNKLLQPQIFLANGV